MRRLILATTAIAALAVPALAPALASADVQRYQLEHATFTVTSPAGTVGQWDNVWHHDFTVNVNPCTNTFEGTDHVYGSDPSLPTFDEVNSGTLNSDGTISLTAHRANDYYINSWSLDHAATDGTITDAITQPSVPWAVEMKVSKPVITNLTTFKNHGQYVSSQGGGADAAHACIGMPINSSN